jgi:hypothetical protein
VSVHTRFGETARRIGTLTSVIRTRGEDDLRIARNGGANGSLDRRVSVAVARLEAVADKLEKQLV